VDEDFLKPFEDLAREWDDLATKHMGSMQMSYSDPVKTCQTASRKVREALKESRKILAAKE
jgi:hypothetical protein